jgi:hypothetical protein
LIIERHRPAARIGLHDLGRTTELAVRFHRCKETGASRQAFLIAESLIIPPSGGNVQANFNVGS